MWLHVINNAFICHESLKYYKLFSLYIFSIYTLQANGKSFSSVLDLINAMSPQFVDYMHISTRDGFKENGFSEKIIDELVSATLTVNYGQSTNVHKFVGKWTENVTPFVQPVIKTFKKSPSVPLQLLISELFKNKS